MNSNSRFNKKRWLEMDKVVHFEIPADDLQRAKKFYEKCFDWKIEKYPMPGAEYYGINTVEVDDKHTPKTPGAINGGLTERDAVEKNPVIAVNVSSMEESLKKIQAEGGKVVRPSVNIGGMGLYALVEDTEGNVIGLWQDLAPTV